MKNNVVRRAARDISNYLHLGARTSQEHLHAAEALESGRYSHSLVLFGGAMACAGAGEVASGVFDSEVMIVAGGIGAAAAAVRVTAPLFHRLVGRLTDVLPGSVAGPDSGERTDRA